MILGILSNHNSSSSIISEYFYLFTYFLVLNFMLYLCIRIIKLQCILLCYNTAFYRNIQNIYTFCRDFFLVISTQEKKNPVFLFLNLEPSTVTQGLSDNRYFTAVGVFLRHLNAKHQLSDVQHIKVKVQILCGPNLNTEG